MRLRALVAVSAWTWALACALACGCGGDPARAPDAAVNANPDGFVALVACTATFTGNFAEVATTAAACATATGAQLVVTVPSTNLIAPLAITLASATGPGDYSSETAAAWSAAATRMIGHDTCVLDAGDQVVPHGSFTLHLTTTDHGTLELDQPVRATMFSACGSPLAEHVEVVF
ncbi:MAG: hypothetical protein ABI467_05285 [Kofleriaceae bacterium]